MFLLLLLTAMHPEFNTHMSTVVTCCCDLPKHVPHSKLQGMRRVRCHSVCKEWPSKNARVRASGLLRQQHLPDKALGAHRAGFCSLFVSVLVAPALLVRRVPVL